MFEFSLIETKNTINLIEQQAAVTTTTKKISENSMKKEQPTIIKTPIIQNQKANMNQTVIDSDYEKMC